MKTIILELIKEYGQPIAVSSIELWTTVESMGNYETDYKNGALWSWNNKLYYLSHLNLQPKDLLELKEFYSF